MSTSWQSVRAEPERVLDAAAAWIGTPYRHQGRRAGVGCDCLGLVIGLWEALVGPLPEQPGSYCADWAEAGGQEHFLEALRRHCIGRDVAEAVPGDILLFRWRDGVPAKHAAILSGPDEMIHAYQGHAVVRSPLGPHWRARIAAAFSYPARG